MRYHVVDSNGNIKATVTAAMTSQVQQNTPQGYTAIRCEDLTITADKYRYSFASMTWLPLTNIIPQQIRLVPYRKRVVLTTAMAGKVDFVYDIPYEVLPVIAVGLTDPSDTGRLTYTILNEAKTGCSIRVKRGQKLPLIGSLLGFDVFEGGVVVGVVVHLTAAMTT